MARFAPVVPDAERIVYEGWLISPRYSSYPDILDVLRRFGASGHDLGVKLFERIVFNILIGNTDDQARNHAAFWDGQHLELTPAYDLCPQLRSGTEANQAMDISRKGARASRVATCLDAASDYGLTRSAAADIADRQVTAVRDNWADACDLSRLTTVERGALLGRQLLNPYALD